MRLKFSDFDWISAFVTGFRFDKMSFKNHSFKDRRDFI